MITVFLTNKGTSSGSFVPFLFFMLFSLFVQGQHSVRLEVFAGTAIAHYDVNSAYNNVGFPKFVESSVRVDASYWLHPKVGVGIGIDFQSYGLMFEDSNPEYNILNGHGALQTAVFPLSFHYRQPLLKIGKHKNHTFNLIVSPAISIGVNSKAIRNHPPAGGQYTPTPGGNVNNFHYNFAYTYNTTPLFGTLDIGGRIEYQAFQRVSIAFALLHYGGIGEIGRLDATYHPEGQPARSVKVFNRGTQFSSGVYFSFDFLLKKKQTPKNEL